MIAESKPNREPNEPPPPPKSGRVRRPRRREKRIGRICLNCGHETSTKFCPECGQENLSVNISLWEIFHEAIEEFVRVDSKLIRTLIPLFFRPGKLTREWTAGRRISYVSPLKLYLTAAAIFFLALSLIPNNEGKEAPLAIRVKASPGSSNKSMAEQAEESRKAMEESAAQVEESVRDLPAVFQYPVRQLNKLNYLAEGSSQEKNQRLEMLNEQFVEHAPTALFLMMPFFAFALWAIYVRNERYYVEHLVFALHCHSFYFLLLTLCVVIPSATNFRFESLLIGVTTLVVPVYSFAALKSNYRQGWIKTGIKSGMLFCAYCMLFAMAMFGCLLVSVANIPDPVAKPVTKPVSEEKPPKAPASVPAPKKTSSQASSH